MISLDIENGFKSLDLNLFNKVHFYINGEEFQMTELEAELISNKFVYIKSNDSNAHFFSITMRKDEVDGMSEESDESFKKILRNSFVKMLNIVRNIFCGNVAYKENLDFKEIFLISYLADRLNSKCFNIDKEKYNHFSNENIIEILNVLGSNAAAKYAAEHFEAINFDNVLPHRLNLVLSSNELKVSSEESVLNIVEKTLLKYGRSAAFLLKHVEVDSLKTLAKSKYRDLVVEYALNSETHFDSKKMDSAINWTRKTSNPEGDAESENIKIDYQILGRLLKCLNGPPVPKIDLFKMFPGVKASSSSYTMRNTADTLLSESPFKFFNSEDKPDQYIQFDFPSDVFLTSVSALAGGAGDNPVNLVVQASIDGTNYQELGTLTFPSKDYDEPVSVELSSSFKSSHYRLWMPNPNYKGRNFISLKRVWFYGGIE